MKKVLVVVSVLGIVCLAGMELLRGILNGMERTTQAAANHEVARSVVTANNTMSVLVWLVIALLVVIVVLVLFGVIAYLALRNRKPKWASGPNANWGRLDWPQVRVIKQQRQLPAAQQDGYIILQDEEEEDLLPWWPE